MENSAIPHVFKTFVLSIFEWLLKTVLNIGELFYACTLNTLVINVDIQDMFYGEIRYIQ